jgi:hypothetical protein
MLVDQQFIKKLIKQERKKQMLRVRLCQGKVMDLNYCCKWFDEKQFKSILAIIRACQYRQCALSINNRTITIDNQWTKEHTIDKYFNDNYKFFYEYLNHGNLT